MKRWETPKTVVQELCGENEPGEGVSASVQSDHGEQVECRGSCPYTGSDRRVPRKRPGHSSWLYHIGRSRFMSGGRPGTTGKNGRLTLGDDECILLADMKLPAAAG